MRPLVGLAATAAAVDDLRARPECRAELAALLKETSPIYAGRSAGDAERLRAYILATFAEGPPADGILPFALEQIDTGYEAFAVAAAAKVLRNAVRLPPGIATRVIAAIRRLRALDAYVWHDALTTTRPEHADRTMLTELAVTLKAVMAESETERRPAAPQIRDLLGSGVVAFNPTIRLLLQDALHVSESLPVSSPSRTEVATASDCCCCSGAPEPTSPATGPDLSRLPPRSAALQDQDGSIFTFSDFFAGRVSVVAFFYTRCENPNKCSLTIANLAKLQQVLGDDPLFADVRLAAVTYDPAFDTPARLKAYGRDRGMRFDERTKFVRSVDDLTPLATFFSLSVSFGEATVNLHRIELTVLDRMLQPVSRIVRHMWQPQEVAEILATLFL